MEEVLLLKSNTVLREKMQLGSGCDYLPGIVHRKLEGSLCVHTKHAHPVGAPLGWFALSSCMLAGGGGSRCQAAASTGQVS